MIRQADGGLVGAGITTGANGSDIAVARILPSTGQLDPSFSPGGADGDGKLVLDLGGSDVAEDAVVQPNAGSFSPGASRSTPGTSWRSASQQTGRAMRPSTATASPA